MASGAALITAELEREGVEVCFGLPGVHNLALWEALRASPIRLVGVRHEQAAAYAADGYARATRRLGVALTTTGPGAANTLGAVGEAWASRSPILVVATDIPTTLRRPGVYRGVLHETTDQGAMFAPVTAAVMRVRTADELAGCVAEAVAAALAASRPAYLEVPTDLLSAEAGALAPPVARAARLSPADATAEAARALLDAAQRPLIWAGGGARTAGEAVGALAERLAAPVLTTVGGRGVVAPGHPCLVGMPPHVEPAGRLWDEADVVVSVGSDLDGHGTQNFTQPQPPALITVNPDAEDAGKNYRVDVAMACDAEAGCRELARRVRPARRAAGAARAARGGARRGLPRAGRRRPALPGRLLLRGARGRGDPGRHVHPRLLAGGLPRRHAARADPVAGRLGDARLRLPGRARRRARRRRAGGVGVGRRRLPLRLRRARHRRPGAPPAHRGDRRRRRLRDAALGPAQVRRGAPTASTCSRPTSSRSRRRSACKADAVDDLGDGFGEALARHVADPEPSVLVARSPALVPPPTTSPNWYRRRTG